MSGKGSEGCVMERNKVFQKMEFAMLDGLDEALKIGGDSGLDENDALYLVCSAAYSAFIESVHAASEISGISFEDIFSEVEEDFSDLMEKVENER